MIRRKGFFRKKNNRQKRDLQYGTLWVTPDGRILKLIGQSTVLITDWEVLNKII